MFFLTGFHWFSPNSEKLHWEQNILIVASIYHRFLGNKKFCFCLQRLFYNEILCNIVFHRIPAFSFSGYTEGRIHFVKRFVDLTFLEQGIRSQVAS